MTHKCQHIRLSHGFYQVDKSLTTHFMNHAKTGQSFAFTIVQFFILYVITSQYNKSLRSIVIFFYINFGKTMMIRIERAENVMDIHFNI